jgi:hypothetical protein
VVDADIAVGLSSAILGHADDLEEGIFVRRDRSKVCLDALADERAHRTTTPVRERLQPPMLAAFELHLKRDGFFHQFDDITIIIQTSRYQPR